MKSTSSIAAVWLGVVVLVSGTFADEPSTLEQIKKMVGAAKITLTQAIETAQKEVKGGLVFEAELGRDDRLCSLAIADGDLGCWEYAICLKERRNLRMVQAFLDLAVEMSPAMADEAAKTARRATGRAGRKP